MPKRICSIPDCDRPHLARGLCSPHYLRFTRTNVLGGPINPRSPKARICSIDGCGRIHYAKSFCGRHYDRFVRYGDPQGAAPIPNMVGDQKRCIACKQVLDLRAPCVAGGACRPT